MALDANKIMFAQLYGMRDHLALPLGKQIKPIFAVENSFLCFLFSTTADASLPAAKLVAYSDIEEGVAYLSRRIVENRHAINTECGATERRLLKAELRRRLLLQA